MPVTSRPYATTGDLRRLQELAQDVLREGRGARFHPGGLAWARLQHVGREPESCAPGPSEAPRGALPGTRSRSRVASTEQWPTRIWEERGRVLAWGWLRLPASLDMLVHPQRPELVNDVLRWFEAEAKTGELSVTVADDDRTAVAALEARGYGRVHGGAWIAYLQHPLADVPQPEVPKGYALRSLLGDEDVERGVAVHRAAFHPSRVTAESYRNVRRAWPYRPNLDCVAEAPDGSFAAYALAWLDPDTRTGELEPVGTHPDHRRRGLARAVCLFALRRLRDEGAETALVACRGDEAYPVPKRLYESLGFRRVARSAEFRRSENLPMPG